MKSKAELFVPEISKLQRKRLKDPQSEQIDLDFPFNS